MHGLVTARYWPIRSTVERQYKGVCARPVHVYIIYGTITYYIELFVQVFTVSLLCRARGDRMHESKYEIGLL